MSVTGAVVGAIVVTVAFKGLRAAETAVNIAQVFPRAIVGLTEVTLAIGMILLLIVRPAGIFATNKIGSLLLR